MKLVRFTDGTGPRLGALIDLGVVDLAAATALHLALDGMSAESAAAGAEMLAPPSMRQFLAGGEGALSAAERAVELATEHRTLPLIRPMREIRLLAPVGDPGKIVCVGQNYRDHCEEQNKPLPDRPILFAKFATAINHPGEAIVLPALSREIDYEAELAFVIGRRGRHIREQDAADYVAGYMCLNDVSARDIQREDGQWVRAKSFDTFAPMGPWLVTADEVPDPHALGIELHLNGRVMQQSNTSNLVFGVWHLVSAISAVMTLEPGDVVSTGTPGGVGVYRDPPTFLQPGDQVSVAIEGLGTLSNPVTAGAS